MNKAQVDNWRNGVESRLEELTVMSAKQNSDIHYIKESVDEIKELAGCDLLTIAPKFLEELKKENLGKSSKIRKVILS